MGGPSVQLHTMNAVRRIKPRTLIFVTLVSNKETYKQGRQKRET